ncbi:putative ribonuclease H-like domain-containing protein [Tanacetum coccineum]
MEFESTNSGTTAKLPILKLGKYEMWVIRIKQYFQIQDYALWDVIKNGNSWVSIPQTTQENGTSVTKMYVPVTAKEKTNKKNDYPDTKSMFAAIETRFGGNEATRKTQKTLLKQQYENFSATSAESLDSIFNRLQKIVSRLAILGVVIAQEDLNSKILSSLPPEWNTYVVKKSVGASSSAQNLAFMTAPSTSSTNDANTASPQVSTASPNVNTASPQVSNASLSDNVVYAFMVENPNGSDLLHQDLEQIREDDLEAMDLMWQLSLLSMRAKREYRAPRSKEGFDWSDMAEEQVQTNMALMAFSDSKCDDLIVKLNQTEFTATTYKRGLATLEEQLITYRKNEVLFSEEVAVLKRDVACKDYEINVLKSQFEKVKKEKEGIEFKIEKFDMASKDLDQLLGSQITDKSKKGLGYNAVPPPHPLIYNRPKKLDLSYSGLDEFKEPEFKGYGPENSKQESNIVCDKKSDDSKGNFDNSLVKEQVSKHTSSFVESSLNVDKETVFPVDKNVESVKPKNHEKQVKKSVRYAEMYRSQTPRGNQRNWNGQKSNQVGINTARPKIVKTARLNSAVVNAVKGKPQQDDTGFVDSGCSRHMTGNMAYLSDFKEFNRGYVAFGGGAYGGRITGKGTLKTDSLDFEDLPDENQILLKIPRKDNMYSFDMKNIVPKESLTCLVAKATSDESMLWHRRLGHINFKNINKLVKDNLVRGLPTKHFENDQTCVACLKGKQHRASCKSKVLYPITKPFFTLHMDLFGPTFVSSLIHKKYCLVVTNNYSRFTWVFFLTTKDETSEIRKNFIKDIENLVDKKVKIIRSDNGTEFKNNVIDDFCREKGIKREYSVARTPQQNGIAERRNRILIEVARTMLANFKLPTTFWAKAVSTACYVQNWVLVVKPYNKTPYELFRGFKPALSFMRPFGCHVTILNTLDSLGKFDGKSDEGFFVGYSLSSKAFRVYNTRTRRVEENLHIGFLENKPMIEGNSPKWLFDIDSLTQSMNYVPVTAGIISNESTGTQGEFSACTLEEIRQDCIVMPIWKDASYFDSPSKDDNGEPKSAADDQKQDGDGPNNENVEKDKFEYDSIHTASSYDQNNPKYMFTIGASHSLEATHVEFFSEEEEPEVDLGNITNSYSVPTTPNTIIHKDHPIENVIGDVNIAKALSDSSWVEAMQEELLQFKLQQDYKYTRRKIGIFISQDKYVDEILKKFNYTDVKSASTPVDLEKPLVKDGDDDDVDVHLYRSMIGSLMYLTTSRPDIMFAVCVCARFQVTPKTSHLLAIKKIFRYLKGKPTLGLWYSRDSPFELVSYWKRISNKRTKNQVKNGQNRAQNGRA